MRIATLLAGTLGLAACNSLLGVGDVELASDASSSTVSDAGPDRSACKLAARYPRIALDSSSASLTRNDNGNPSMFVEPSPADGLLITLRNNKGGHGTLEAFGSFQLTAADTDVALCGICVLFGAEFDQDTGSISQYYVPRMKGQLQVSTASATQLIGSMQDLELRHVNLDTNSGTTTDNSDHCTVIVDRIDFNLTYKPPTQASRAFLGGLGR
jgi:hypothetical protein